MAELNITAIALGQNAQTEFVEFGEAVALADSVYRNLADSERWHAANNASAVEAGQDGIGIALHAAQEAGQFGVIVTRGTVWLETTGVGQITVKGTTYCVGDANGDISPDTDVGSGEFKTVLGIGGETAGTSDEFLMEPVISNRNFA
jgi:hypothetical protein